MLHIGVFRLAYLRFRPSDYHSVRVDAIAVAFVHLVVPCMVLVLSHTPIIAICIVGTGLSAGYIQRETRKGVIDLTGEEEMGEIRKKVANVREKQSNWMILDGKVIENG